MQKRGEAVKKVILESAAHTFREQGYVSTSVDSISRHAGVSKATVYAHFKNKESLFRAAVCEFVTPILNLLPEPRSVENLREELCMLATKVTKALLSPEKVEWDRMMVATAKKFPNLAQEYFEAGPQKGMFQLAEFLSEQDRTGHIRVEDPLFSAEMFFGMVLGSKIMKNLIFAQAPNLEQERIEKTVDAFLKVHAI